jgi:hypothetical protein
MTKGSRPDLWGAPPERAAPTRNRNHSLRSLSCEAGRYAEEGMRNIHIFVFAMLLGISLSANSLTIGTRIPENQFLQCGLKNLSCLIAIPDLMGAYALKMEGASTIKIEGAVIWSNAAPPEILSMASHIEIELVLVSDGVVVHKEIFSSPANANKPALFEHSFKFDKKISKTAIVGFEIIGPK